ncbi:PAS domain-containing sensor histidine kinase [Cellulophaga algicola]|nr:PAS domain-containing sensor histidine kinase [Cellulophaga algicola]
MKKLEKKIISRYLFFMITIGVLIVSGVLVVSHIISLLDAETENIDLVGKQHMMSKSIVNDALHIGNAPNSMSTKDISRLKNLTNELKNSQVNLLEHYSENNKTIDSLLKKNESSYNQMLSSSSAITIDLDPNRLKNQLEKIYEAQSSYSVNLDLIRDTFQEEVHSKLQLLMNILWIFASCILLIIVGESAFIMRPIFKQLLYKNKELQAINEELELSKVVISKNMLALTKLKIDLETKEAYNRIFIEQAPMAIAMVDNDMCYLAVSKRWITDYKMEGKEFIGRSHYDLFPEISEDWKKMHQRCLGGAIDINNEEPFIRADGSLQWLYWDVRPWYDLDGKIGGILMQTGDITAVKENELESKRTDEIIEKTNEISRIGTWELDLLKNEVYWSTIVCEIHEVPHDFEPQLTSSIHFYKEGKSRNLVVKSVKEAISDGKSFDIEVELVTQNNANIWVRAIGQTELVEGKCTRLFGIFQDISVIKKSEGELLRKNKLLNFAEEITLMGNWQWDTVADVVLWSNNLYNIFKLDKNIEIIKFDTYFSFVHPDDREIVTEYFKKSVNKKSLVKFTHRIIAGDGKVKTIQLLGEVIRDNLGNIIEMIGTCQDITEQKKSEVALIRKNQLLTLGEEIAQMGHWQWDTVVDKVIWSNNLYRIFELDNSKIDLKFETYLSFVHPEDSLNVIEYFEKAAKEKIFDSFSHRIITVTGIIKTVQLMGEVFTNEKGEIIEMIGTGQDVTEQKMVEQKIVAAKENLEAFSKKLIAQNTQLADFTHITSHNLRAPVSNLNTLLDFYKESESESEKLDLFKKIETVIYHLTSTLNTLIEALQTKNDTTKELEKVSFNEILNKTKEILTAEILKSEITIQVDFSEIENINYNKIYLESIFLNLVSNAMKYKAEDRTPKLTIISVITNGKIELKFQDNGLGIDLKKHGHKLFGLNKVFHRHPDARGVGLFMTKTQVEAMGGTIWAESTVNEGTTFIINFNLNE